MVTAAELVDRLLEAPVALAVLADHARLLPQFPAEQLAAGLVPPDADARVVASVELLRHQPFGQFAAEAVEVGAARIGPWLSEGPDVARSAYQLATVVHPIAEAVVARFFDELVRPVDLDAQQWWTCVDDVDRVPRRLFEDYDAVYDGGEFTAAGLWTVTAPPDELHARLAMAWELDWAPASRWHLPVRPPVRVHEIVTPADWVALVGSYPDDPDARSTARRHTSWSIAASEAEARRTGVLGLAAVAGQRAAAVAPTVHRQPDWAAVAEDLDGVHLTWAGFLTTEGFVDVGADGSVCLLRYWLSERTHWLHDVFGEPSPLGAPVSRYADDRNPGVDVRVDARRRARDQRRLAVELGRREPPP